MAKFKIRELNSLTDAYKYTGDGFTLKITYDENDDKCIEIKNTKNDKIHELENKIVSYKHDLSKIVRKINNKDFSKLNFKRMEGVIIMENFCVSPGIIFNKNGTRIESNELRSVICKTKENKASDLYLEGFGIIGSVSYPKYDKYLKRVKNRKQLYNKLKKLGR